VARAGGQWIIQAKQVNLIDCDQCIRNPSIIL
jgi:benzoate/toluate 1,2-dioxygenase beta subunit